MREKKGRVVGVGVGMGQKCSLYPLTKQIDIEWRSVAQPCRICSRCHATSSSPDLGYCL